VLFPLGVALGLGAPVLALTGTVTPPATPSMLSHPTVGAAGFVLALAGLATVLYAQAGMGASWRIGVDQAERTALVTGGAFALVRNPILTGMAAVAVGVGLMVPTLVSAAAVAALLAAVQIQVRVVEEPYLARVHGAAYLAYVSRAGRFLPRLGRRLSGRPKVASGGS